jgi:hypothetical protein
MLSPRYPSPRKHITASALVRAAISALTDGFPVPSDLSDRLEIAINFLEEARFHVGIPDSPSPGRTRSSRSKAKDPKKAKP